MRGGKREGAGRPTVDEQRKPRGFKATDAEWEQIKLNAQNAGYASTSEYIRVKALTQD